MDITRLNWEPCEEHENGSCGWTLLEQDGDLAWVASCMVEALLEGNTETPIQILKVLPQQVPYTLADDEFLRQCGIRPLRRRLVRTCDAPQRATKPDLRQMDLFQ
jgi:hypothetical protein